MSESLLTTREVAEMLGLSSEAVLRRWRAGELPGFRLSSKVLRFRQSELIAWLERYRAGLRVDDDPVVGLRVGCANSVGRADLSDFGRHELCALCVSGRGASKRRRLACDDIGRLRAWCCGVWYFLGSRARADIRWRVEAQVPVAASVT
jgi:excisionase family DNA binding protein